MVSVNDASLEALEKLGRLRQAGAITEQEFVDAKQNILAGGSANGRPAEVTPEVWNDSVQEEQWLSPRRLPRELLMVCGCLILLGMVSSIYLHFTHQRAEQNRQIEAQNSAAAEESEAAAAAAAVQAGEQQVLAQQQANEQKAAEQQAAQNQSAQADLEGARAEHDLAEQSINQAWKMLSAASRQRLLPAQRAWIKKKAADCLLEAASTTTDPLGKESARLKCDTKQTQDRYIWVKQYLDADSNQNAPAATGDSSNSDSL